MKNNNRWILKVLGLVCAALILSVLPVSMLVQADDGEDETTYELRANLTSPGGTTATYGNAKYAVTHVGSRKLEVEAKSVNLPNSTVLTVYVDEVLVGQAVVYRRKAKLELESSHGQNVPTVTNGSTVAVRNGNSVLISGVFAGSGSTPTPTVSPTGTPPPNTGRLTATLTGPTINGVLPNGFGEYKVKNNGSRELEIYVNQINLPVNTLLSVLVDSTPVGQIALNYEQRGRLELESEHGQNVPVVIAGSTLVIKNGTTTILSGIFTGSTNPTPSPTPGGQGRYFEAKLRGTGITPPVTTNGIGEVKIRLNATETQATVSGEFEYLSSFQTSANVNVTIGSTTTTIFNLSVIGGTQGHFLTRTFDVSPAQVQQLRTGLVFAIIGTVNFPNGEIAGTFRNHSGNSDFDGDGSDDVSVYRPSEGIWYIQNSNGNSMQTLGSSGDKVVSADYDGDGKTDAAVFSTNGTWTIRRSSDGGTTTQQFGYGTDLTVRGDFDGDGRNDLAVFRPETGVWYVQKSNGSGDIVLQFGLADDIPVSSDFDGDGKIDIAVFRPSNGVWYWMKSSDGQFNARQYGVAGDIPLGGDFDGDGKSDLSVYRPSDGVWYIKRSSDGTYDFRQFGLSTDIPVAGNYDSDGKMDIAVFRPSNGVWYIWRTVDGGFDYRSFGVNGDIPTTAK
ncbi:MAG: FG-GAP-like repeat-containing protein [Pyrinomonadaceae bacterium]